MKVKLLTTGHQKGGPNDPKEPRERTVIPAGTVVDVDEKQAERLIEARLAVAADDEDSEGEAAKPKKGKGK